MAVIAVWQCDRDGSMFQNKKDAEEYDKMLELAENISAFIGNNIQGLDSGKAEAIGLLLARERELLAKACKGKPEVLLEASADAPVETAGEAAEAGDEALAEVTPLQAKG